MLSLKNHLLHDLITQVFLRSLQYGIVVMGFIDAFVCAHHQHRRIRFMTAITSADTHAYQATCLTRDMPAVPRLNVRLPKPNARYPHLPNVRGMGHLCRRGYSRCGCRQGSEPTRVSTTDPHVLGCRQPPFLTRRFGVAQCRL